MVAAPSDGGRRPQRRSSRLLLGKEGADKDLKAGEQGRRGLLRPLR